MKNFGFYPKLILILLVSYSCGNPFRQNIFGGVDKYQLPAKESLSGIASILEEALDEGFLDALVGDSEFLKYVKDQLNEVVEDVEARIGEGDITDEQKQVLLVSAALDLTEGEADENLENTNDIIKGLIDETFSLSLEDDNLLYEVFEADDSLEPQAQTEKLTNQITALIDGADKYKLYEEASTDENGDFSSVNGAEEVDIAYKSLLSGLTAYIVENIKDSEISQDIKDSNPAADTNNPTEEEKETWRIAAFTEAIADEDKNLPDYTLPPGMDEDSPKDEIVEAMLEEQGLSGVVGAGLDYTQLLEDSS